MRKRLGWDVATAAVLLGVLAGCVAPPPAATPRPSSSPSATTVPVGGRPTIAFDGRCEDIVTAQEVGTATGMTLTASSATLDLQWAAITVLGGVQCAWKDTIWETWVTLIPAKAISNGDAVQGAPHCYGGDITAGEKDVCSFSSIVGDYWFAGVVYTAAGSGITATDAITSLTKLVAPRAEAHPAHMPPAVPTGSWSHTLDCEIFAGAGDSAGLGTLSWVPADGLAEAGPGFYASLESAGYVGCLGENSDNSSGASVSVGVLPGAGWLLDEIRARPSAVPADVPGYDAVLFDQTIYASDGVNIISVAARGPSSEAAAAPLTGALLAVLSP